MKKLLTLVALLTVSAWIAGCGDPAPAPPAKPVAPPSTTGAPAVDDDKPMMGEGEKPADTDEKPADEETETEAPKEN